MKFSKGTHQGFTVQENTLFTCSLCPFITNLRLKLKIHTEVVHKQISEAQHEQSCGMSVTSEMVLQRHKKANHRPSHMEQNITYKSKSPPGNGSSSVFFGKKSLKQYTDKTDVELGRIKKDVQVHPIFKLRNRENRSSDVEKKPKEFSRKIKVEKKCDKNVQESTDPQIKKFMTKLVSKCNIKKEKISDSESVDIEMSDANSPASSVVIIEQPCSGLSQSVGRTPASHGLNSIHEEARQLRSRILLSKTFSTLLSLLERVLELSSSATIEICTSLDFEARSQAIECFEYVWGASKIAIGRWEGMEGSVGSNSFLGAVEYAYKILPIFIKWEKSKHIEMVKNVILLTMNTVKSCQRKPSSIKSAVKKEPLFSVKTTGKNRSLSAKTPRIVDPKVNVVPSVAKAIIKKEIVPLLELPEDKNLRATWEFCRLANIATWQDTKGRTTSGFKDNSGVYHPMYRYGPEKMISLYCPAHVTHLKCCGKIFRLPALKTHVSQQHEAGQTNRTEPSISPL